jgi:hypothetical protein
MDKRMAIKYMAAIVTTLSDFPEGSPSGTLYTALATSGATLDDYNTVLGICQKGGLVTVKAHYVTITEEGKQTAAKIKEAIPGL